MKSEKRETERHGLICDLSDDEMKDTLKKAVVTGLEVGSLILVKCLENYFRKGR